MTAEDDRKRRRPFPLTRPLITSKRGICTLATFADGFNAAGGDSPPPWIIQEFGVGAGAVGGGQMTETGLNGNGLFTKPPVGGLPITLQWKLPAQANPTVVNALAYDGVGGIQLILQSAFQNTIRNVGVAGYTFPLQVDDFSAGHIWHATIDALGNPSVWRDGIAQVLTPVGPAGAPAPQLSVGMVTGASAFTASDYLVVAAGLFPPATIFCDINGNPIS